jgi:hypothetical protein
LRGQSLVISSLQSKPLLASIPGSLDQTIEMVPPARAHLCHTRHSAHRAYQSGSENHRSLARRAFDAARLALRPIDAN